MIVILTQDQKTKKELPELMKREGVTAALLHRKGSFVVIMDNYGPTGEIIQTINLDQFIEKHKPKGNRL